MYIKRIFLAIMFVLLFSGYSLAYENGDVQYWNTNAVEWQAKKDWKASIEEEMRFGNNAGEFYYEHTDIGLTYSGIVKWLDVKASYRQIFKKDKKDWKYENMPNLNGTVKFDLFNLKFSDRNRIEYRDIEDKKDNWRYRNKVTVSLPKLTSFELQPYLADEIFVDLNKGIFNKNRLYAGTSFKLLKELKAEVFYLFESSEAADKWSNINVIGTKLRLLF